MNSDCCWLLHWHKFHAILASVLALYGYQVVPMQYGDARWSHVVLGGPRMLPGDCLGTKRMFYKVWEKVFLATWRQGWWGLGVPPSTTVSNL